MRFGHRQAGFIALLLCSVSTQAAIELEDARGQVVHLAAPAQRIVALAPHFVENLFAIGAGGQIVGTIDSSDYPDAAKAITRVGAYNSISVEAVLALKPDLVLAWQSGNSARVLAKLEDLGLTVYVEEPRSAEDVGQSLSNLGVLSGQIVQGQLATQDFHLGLTRLSAKYGGLKRVGVFYEVWHAPLQTLNGEHVVSELIERCGGHNVFADAGPLAPQVSIEAVLSRAPDVIIVGASEEQPLSLPFWQRWTQLPAVAAGHIYPVRPDWIQRYTPRMLDGMAQLCAALDQARS